MDYSAVPISVFLATKCNVRKALALSGPICFLASLFAHRPDLCENKHAKGKGNFKVSASMTLGASLPLPDCSRDALGEPSLQRRKHDKVDKNLPESPQVHLLRSAEGPPESSTSLAAP